MDLDRMTREELVEELKRLSRERLKPDTSPLRRRLEMFDHASLELDEALVRIEAMPYVEFLHVIAEQARVIAGIECAALAIRGGPESASGSLRGPSSSAVFAGSPPDERTTDWLGVPIPYAHRTVGTLYLAHARGAPEFSDDDRRLVAMFAERAGIAIEIARLSLEARAAVEARDNLLAIVSHDLRSPLSAIQLSANLLARRHAGPERRRTGRQVDVIMRSSQRMNRLIDDLLLAATIEAQQLVVQPKPEQVAPIIEDAIAALERIRRNRPVSMDYEIAPDLPAAWCDRERIVQALSNLIDTAAKLSRENGTIRIEACACASEILFVVSNDKDAPQLSEEDAAHLFDRCGKASVARRHGFGLGLLVAKGIVEAHAGRVWIDARPGVGTGLCFTLPLAQQDTELG